MLRDNLQGCSQGAGGREGGDVHILLVLTADSFSMAETNPTLLSSHPPIKNKGNIFYKEKKNKKECDVPRPWRLRAKALSW